jgi:hypothetical protein
VWPTVGTAELRHQLKFVKARFLVRRERVLGQNFPLFRKLVVAFVSAQKQERNRLGGCAPLEVRDNGEARLQSRLG